MIETIAAISTEAHGTPRRLTRPTTGLARSVLNRLNSSKATNSRLAQSRMSQESEPIPMRPSAATLTGQGDAEHGPGGDRLGRPEAADRLPEDHRRDREQGRASDEGGEDLPAQVAERLGGRGRLAREPGDEERQPERRVEVLGGHAVGARDRARQLLVEALQRAHEHAVLAGRHRDAGALEVQGAEWWESGGRDAIRRKATDRRFTTAERRSWFRSPGKDRLPRSLSRAQPAAAREGYMDRYLGPLPPSREPASG